MSHSQVLPQVFVSTQMYCLIQDYPISKGTSNDGLIQGYKSLASLPQLRTPKEIQCSLIIGWGLVCNCILVQFLPLLNPGFFILSQNLLPKKAFYNKLSAQKSPPHLRVCFLEEYNKGKITTTLYSLYFIFQSLQSICYFTTFSSQLQE